MHSRSPGALGRAAAALAAAAFAFPRSGLAGESDYPRLIPKEKAFPPGWVAGLTARGEPRTYTSAHRGRDLRFIGMPVGGLFCGTVYLGGDGRLWLWDVFNDNRHGITPGRPVTYRGRGLSPIDGAAYVDPPVADEHRGVEQGFVLAVRSAAARIARPLDRTGFADVRFTGQYPIGTVRYADPEVPVEVTLEAFSPFIPLNARDSSLPVTVMSFALRNLSAGQVEVELTGSLENAVLSRHPDAAAVRRNRLVRSNGLTVMAADAVAAARPDPRPDVLFEDWSKPTYEGWQVEGTAFGEGPVPRAQIPAYQGDVGGDTDRVANSHASAPGGDVAAKDGAKGRLTSRPFALERDYVALWIGGGAHRDRTCVNLRVGGEVVASLTGRNSNRMEPARLDARPHRGKTATIEIVDDHDGGWGNVGVGRIFLTDAADVGIENVGDRGSMALALLGPPAEIVGGEGEVRLPGKATCTLGRRITLAPGASARVDFLIAWHFPNVPGILGGQQRHYAATFADAAAVARYVAGNFDRLAGDTRLWRDTWYDSTLPHWFLDRTFATISCLATTTCHRFKDGRFWAWEGVGCCPGTCNHVWHYAQAMGRIFPEVERDHRERVDFGLALAPDGTIAFRAEAGGTYAIDGQAGRILGAYREHQMSADDAFLRRVWPNVKRAAQKLIATDGDGDGLVRGPLHNTLDADWYGTVPWLCGMYQAGLRAAEAMATEMGDDGFARACRGILDVAAANLDAKCWSEECRYYVQRAEGVTGAHVGVYEGCHIDQVLGEAWTRQVGLAGVMTASHVRAALRSLWEHNFTMDVSALREAKRDGRWYAMPGDGGLVMVTFPFGGEMHARAGHWSAMYFNECMSGFEHQVAAHMIWEGMVTEGLAVTRATHDRYSGTLRNPYNEVECSDHYARAMASYGTFLAACGFEHHGPKGHIGFAPRLTPERFRAAFTSAQGWGTFSQKASRGALEAAVAVKWGRLVLKTVSLAGDAAARRVAAELDGKSVRATLERMDGKVTVNIEGGVTVEAGRTLSIVVR